MFVALGVRGPEPDTIRRMVVSLASRTGWSMRALLDLTMDELQSWLEAARDLEPRQ